jgi:hypothetical protein
MQKQKDMSRLMMAVGRCLQLSSGASRRLRALVIQVQLLNQQPIGINLININMVTFIPAGQGDLETFR